MDEEDETASSSSSSSIADGEICALGFDEDDDEAWDDSDDDEWLFTPPLTPDSSSPDALVGGDSSADIANIGIIIL